MPKYAFVFAIFTACMLRFQTDADSLGSRPLWQEGLKMFIKSIINPIKDLLNPPVNKNSSIGYRVFTTKNPKKPCFLEPNRKALRDCPINSKHLTIFIIHGFIVDLNPGNLFEVLKDVLLEKGEFNVIIVDWTKYDGPPYELAIANVYLIGGDIAELIKFLMKNTGINPENIVIVGHSLGAHMAGAVGKQIKNLRRIDGVDPAGPFYETPILSRLSYTDADFVQVIHTSAEIFGSGLYETIGHMDFFVNGGIAQPICQFGNSYIRLSGENTFIDNWMFLSLCNHEMSLVYYINSINNTDCKFYGTLCSSYQDFVDGKCPSGSSLIGVMGVYGAKIPNIPPLSNFYLGTSSESPYCLNDGFKTLDIETF